MVVWNDDTDDDDDYNDCDDYERGKYGWQFGYTIVYGIVEKKFNSIFL